MRKCLLLLLLPCLAASLSVTSVRAKRGAVHDSKEPTIDIGEAKRGTVDDSGEPTVASGEAKRGAMVGSRELGRWRRSLPSLTAPWTSVVEELARDPDTEIPQQVQDQFAGHVSSIPTQVIQDWNGFHSWGAKIHANADQREANGEGTGAFLKDANYYSLDRSRRGAPVNQQSLDLGLETALDNLDAAMLALPSSMTSLSSSPPSMTSVLEKEKDLQHHGHSHRGKSRTFLRSNRHKRSLGESVSMLGALSSLDKMLGLVEEEEDNEQEDSSLEVQEDKLEKVAASVARALEVVEGEGRTGEAFSHLLQAETRLNNLAAKELEKEPEHKVSRRSAREVSRRSARPAREELEEEPEHKVSRRSARQEQLLSREEYDWLEQQYSITPREVAKVKSLSEEEFAQLVSELEMVESREVGGFQGLVDTLRSARNLVPLEMEAAALGAWQVGKHLGGRAITLGERVITEAQPAYEMVRESSMDFLEQAGEFVSEDEMTFLRQGGDLATRRAQQAAVFLGPRLAQLGEAVDRIQGQLLRAAGDAASQVDPKVVPALQDMAEELREAVFLARDLLPVVLKRAGEDLQPLVDRVKEGTMYTQVVAPLSSSVYEAAASGGEGIGQLYSQYSPRVELVASQTGEALGTLASTTGQRLGEAGGRLQPVVEGQTTFIRTRVAPAIKDAVKTTMHRVFTGVPQLVQKMSHEAHDAAKVFRGKYSATLEKMRSKEKDPEALL